jgi:hypothetical protein
MTRARAVSTRSRPLRCLCPIKKKSVISDVCDMAQCDERLCKKKKSVISDVCDMARRAHALTSNPLSCKLVYLSSVVKRTLLRTEIRCLVRKRPRRLLVMLGFRRCPDPRRRVLAPRHLSTPSSLGFRLHI